MNSGSPWTPARMALRLRLDDVAWTSQGELAWLEGRSDRSTIMLQGREGGVRELTPEQSVRASVGYGGGDFAVWGDDLLCVPRGGALARIRAGESTRPIVPRFGAVASPAPSPDGVEAMGRTNDAILYGGRVHLSVRGSDEAARALAAQLPSRNSKDYGRSFAEIFKAVEYDFYKIDPALFAPAEVWVSNLDSGSSFHGGALNMELLRGLWLKEA